MPFAPAFVLLAAGILAAFALPRRTAAGGTWLLLTGACAWMAWTAVGTLTTGTHRTLTQLALPLIGAFDFELTPLAALFVLVTAAVFAVAFPFQLRDCLDWPRARRGAFVAFIALTLAAMLALFTAASVVSFLVAWEIAALGIWALIGFETRKREPTAAGLLTISLSEAGSLAGLAGLLLLGFAARSPSLDAIAAAAPRLPPGIVVAGCLLTFFGFGMKAGVLPLNLWLPSAHGAAPRSISPILSAATLNLGLYAFLRIDAPLAHTDARLGLTILAVGAATALTGIMYALVERDLKRLLAQSSIENMGIVTAGFGAGFAFAALGHPVLGGLALIAGLYHMLNHSAYKALLFLGAGGLDAATGTHDLDRMGGLLRRLPSLGSLFVIGAFAIAALPPLNGFVSEWMLLQSLLRVVETASVPARIVFGLAGAALALAAGLAVTCFAMITTSALLGQPRSRAAAEARPAPRTVWVPMGLLALVCFGLAVWATGVIPVLGRLGAPIVGADATSALVPAFFGHPVALAAGVVHDLTQLGAQLGRGIVPLRGLIVMHSDAPRAGVVYAMSTALSFAVLALMLLVVWIATRVVRRRRHVARRIPWNGGIAHLKPEMSYTATTFAAPVRVLFDAVFSPEVARRRERQGAFVTAERHHEIRLQLIDRLLIAPLGEAVRGLAARLAALHHGRVTAYAGYVLASLIAVMLATRILLSPMNVISWAFPALALSLCASLLPPSRGRSAVFLAGSWAAVVLVLIGSAYAVASGPAHRVTEGMLVILPGFGFALDPLRGFFLIVAAGVYAVSAPFMLRDVRERSRPRARLLLAVFVVLFAAILTVLLAAGVASLLFAWEIMSLALSTLVFLGRGETVETRAGLLTLAFSEAGALAALAGLLILAGAAGTLSLAGIAAAAPRLSEGVVWAGFLLTFFGFGVKTAIMPVNGWMTDAYGAAPRGVLPLFSGATLNLGVFTLWVVDGPLASHALWPALAVLTAGALTALLGITYALTESNMTRLLTRSSIENLGIVVAALGAGFAFIAMQRPTLGGLALIAGLYHMLNHSAYKTLLFIGAGGIGDTVGHDDMNRLGGLLKPAPLFGTVFLLGCFAIASLPPFNGFVSEWLILQSLLRIVELGPVPVRIVFALSGAALALTAGLAVTCFAMLATSTLLGMPRSREAAGSARMPASVTVPMTVLIVVCFGLGVLATGVIPVLGRITAPLTGVDVTAHLVPAFFGHPSALAAGVVHDLTQLGAQLGRGLLPLRGLVVLHSDAPRAGVVYAMSTALTFAVLVVMLFVVWLLARVLRRRRRVVRRVPWNAGIPGLRPEMAYTPTTFAAPVRVLFDAVLNPEVARQEQRQGAFLTAREHQVVHVHLVDRLLLAPLIGGMQSTARWLARMHHGKITVYASYVLASLVVVILAATIALS